jgi:hypothetical protein
MINEVPENTPVGAQQQLQDSKAQLLSTIRLPNNLKLLSDRLPKSKYEEGAAAETQHNNLMRARGRVNP